MQREYWPLVEALARDLALSRADAELAQLSAYLGAHRDADDFFGLLDDLAGPAGTALGAGDPGAYAALRDACQRLHPLPPDALPAAVAWAARLLRYHVIKLPPAPRPLPAPRPPAAAARPGPAGPPGVAPRPVPVAPPAPSGRPLPTRPAAGAPPGPRPPRPSGPVPAAAERRGPPPGPGPLPTPPGARPAPPGRVAPVPAERPGAPPAPAEAPRPAAPRRPPTMEEMLRALQEQYSGGGRGPEPAQERPPRVESKRDRLRREQEEIRERYRREMEERERSS